MDVIRAINNIREAIDGMSQAKPEMEFLISPETGAACHFGSCGRNAFFYPTCFAKRTGAWGQGCVPDGQRLADGATVSGAMYGGYRCGAVECACWSDAVVVHAGPLRREGGFCRRANILPCFAKLWEACARISASSPRTSTVRCRLLKRSPEDLAACSGSRGCGAADVQFGQHRKAEGSDSYPQLGPCARVELDRKPISSPRATAPCSCCPYTTSTRSA